jgi:hypothetical protein
MRPIRLDLPVPESPEIWMPAAVSWNNSPRSSGRRADPADLAGLEFFMVLNRLIVLCEHFVSEPLLLGFDKLLAQFVVNAYERL